MRTYQVILLLTLAASCYSQCYDDISSCSAICPTEGSMAVSTTCILGPNGNYCCYQSENCYTDAQPSCFGEVPYTVDGYNCCFTGLTCSCSDSNGYCESCNNFTVSYNYSWITWVVFPFVFFAIFASLRYRRIYYNRNRWRNNDTTNVTVVETINTTYPQAGYPGIQMTQPNQQYYGNNLYQPQPQPQNVYGQAPQNYYYQNQPGYQVQPGFQTTMI